ncbi:MAG: phosphatidyl-myo-inositol dimannoside synthase, partial [Actinomycetota bacterium]|nr:phosphatidyl-myo-inositol dimannoside synthase [Actinomycetota bacterium]
MSWSMARGLAARGHDVTVVTTAHPDGRTQEIDQGVRVHYVAGSTWRRYQRRWWQASYRLLEAEHSADPYDAILSQSAGGRPYLARARRRLGVPSVVVLHGSARGEVRTAGRGARSPRGVYRLARLGWRLPRQVAGWRRAAGSVDRWLAVSPEVAADNARELGIERGRMAVMPVGADTGAFRPRAGTERSPARLRLGLPAGAEVVVLVTRLEREKGVQVVLEAARLLAGTHPDLHLLVAGTGRHEARLRRTASRLGLDDRCRFLGLVDHADLPAVLAAADVFVLPSLCAEGRPAAVVEAMAAGLPVVATRSAGTTGLVVDGVTGRLVPPGDTGALVEAVAGLLADGPRRRAMGRRAREHALRWWTEDSMIDAVEAALLGAVTAPRPGDGTARSREPMALDAVTVPRPGDGTARS